MLLAVVALFIMDMESDWIALAREGDNDAFKSLIRLYKDDVFRFCYHLLHEPEEASDLAQETFITAYRKIRLYKPIGAFKTWLFTIAYRNFLNLNAVKKRRLAAAPYLEEEFTYLARLNIETPEPDADAVELVHCALERLAPDYRHPLVLRYQEGLSPSEIAKALGCSELAIKTRLYRGKRLFSKIMVFLTKMRQKNEL